MRSEKLLPRLITVIFRLINSRPIHSSLPPCSVLCSGITNTSILHCIPCRTHYRADLSVQSYSLMITLININIFITSCSHISFPSIPSTLTYPSHHLDSRESRIKAILTFSLSYYTIPCNDEMRNMSMSMNLLGLFL